MVLFIFRPCARRRPVQFWNRTLVAALACTLVLSAVAADKAKKEERQPRAIRGRPNAEQLFEKLDTNQDGKLSPSEFAALWKGEKAAKHRGEKSAGKTAEKVFSELDKNRDGFLTFETFKAWLDDRLEQRKVGLGLMGAQSDTNSRIVSGTAEQVFERLDTNKDRKLSLEEFSAAWNGPDAKKKAQEAFPKIDKQHKGFLEFEAFKDWLEETREQ
jgi:Ca2+-binding EF-hand superfamily protein